jgi:hypothetical protein
MGEDQWGERGTLIEEDGEVGGGGTGAVVNVCEANEESWNKRSSW